MEVLIDILGLYLLYKLVFDFIIPVSQSTKDVKKQFSDMQSKMQEQAKQFQQQSSDQQSTFKAAPKKPSSEDYIDYEEIK